MATLGNTTVLSLNVLNNITTSGTIYENGTALSSKYAAASHNHDSAYLGKTAKAADSSKLNNQEASYYATAAAVTTNTNNIATNTSNINKIINGGQAVNSAVYDEQGNKINTTYATKTEATAASKKTSSANSTSKLFLIGATSQSADASTTYSNSNCYVGTDNCLYSNSTKVLTSHAYRPIQVNGSSILTSGSSTALNLKAGTNISLSNSNGTVTISSTASGGGGGMTCAQVFEGAGDRSGQYHQAGSWSTKINIVNQGYKLLIFYIDVNDYKFPCCAQVPASSFTYYLRYTCSNYDGSVTVVDITYSDSEFTAEKVSGSGMLYNVDIYAYK